jgi:phosphoesterase RecJ-like protein
MLDKKTSALILEEINNAKNILLSFHVSPDGDCVGSTLAFERFLKKIGKNTKIISFSKIPSNFRYLPGIEKVEIENFKRIDFKKYDLFVCLDIATEKLITKSPYPKDEFPNTFKVINIDHHISNSKFGDINLVENLSSTCEVLYELFKLWKVSIDKTTAQLLFLGLFTDTGCFQYPSTSEKSFLMGAELMKKGASLQETVLAQYRSYNFRTLKYWGLVLDNMQMDKSKKFVWSKISMREIEDLGIESEDEIAAASSFFAPITKGIEFGIIIDENEGFIKASLRSRSNFDVSKLAQNFGGGGHKQAAGFILTGVDLDEAEEQILKVSREAIKNL